MAKKTKTNNQDSCKCDELKLQLSQMEDHWKRAIADYQNLEKRTREQNGLMIQLAGLTIIEKLLPLMDNLTLAEAHLNDPGLTLVSKQLADILDSEGVKKIEALGIPFDPTTMECIELVAGKKDMVVEVLSNGYRLGNRVIRPVKVKVGAHEN